MTLGLSRRPLPPPPPPSCPVGRHFSPAFSQEDMTVSKTRMEPTLSTVSSLNSQEVVMSLVPFIGSPKYFGPILHYLRTNSIDIPSGYKLSSMRVEAEFYGIQKIVDHIDFLETEKKNDDNLQRGEYTLTLLVPYLKSLPRPPQ